MYKNSYTFKRKRPTIHFRFETIKNAIDLTATIETLICWPHSCSSAIYHNTFCHKCFTWNAKKRFICIFFCFQQIVSTSFSAIKKAIVFHDLLTCYIITKVNDCHLHRFFRKRNGPLFIHAINQTCIAVFTVVRYLYPKNKFVVSVIFVGEQKWSFRRFFNSFKDKLM